MAAICLYMHNAVRPVDASDMKCVISRWVIDSTRTFPVYSKNLNRYRLYDRKVPAVNPPSFRNRSIASVSFTTKPPFLTRVARQCTGAYCTFSPQKSDKVPYGRLLPNRPSFAPKLYQIYNFAIAILF